jgi:hypothetical protein
MKSEVEQSRVNSGLEQKEEKGENEQTKKVQVETRD